ncbi:MAG: biotin-dependent carboxyltransferase family protein [Bacillota bacterium]|nr:biotin-dependent carboxyltransferase family protein [Bacillota bacterium]
MRINMRVENPGLLTTVQDIGRFGFEKFGMPVAGAMDSYALQVANILVGNPPNEGGLEISFLGLTLTFEGQGLIAITGADLGATLNGQQIKPWQSLQVNSGDELKFASLKKGCRAYLAVQGGFDIPCVMGSKSTYLRGSIGGYKGRKLLMGDKLTSNEIKRKLSPEILPEEFIPSYEKKTIRVILGPQADYFSTDELYNFLSSTYKITNQYDRMGYRLEGPSIKHSKGPDIISDGIVPGSVQVPGHGQPIIMLADCQTAGGYSKIATVISVDLPMLAQLMPGNELNFEEVTIEKAQLLYNLKESKLAKLYDYMLNSRP